MNNTIDLRKKQIENFFNDDLLDFTKFPDESIKGRLERKGIIDTTIIKNPENKKAFKELLFSTILFEKPYSCMRNTNSFNYIFKLPDFFNKLGNIDFVTIDVDELKAIYKQYCLETKLAKDAQKIIVSCQYAVLELRDDRERFDRDFWDSSIVTIASNRVNKSMPFNSMNFRLIKNIQNREYVKIYLKHLIGNTEMAYTTIYNYFSILNLFCKHIGDTEITDVTSSQVLEYVRKKSNKSTDLINRFLNILSDFYKYLGVKQLLDKPSPITESMFVDTKYQTINNCVDAYVINQIFKHLHKAPFNYILMYLISYSTGMRVSDICQLKKDCLFYDGNGGYYIEFSCQKMQKPIRNLICKALYELIEEQIKIINQLEYKEEYLFPSKQKRNHPYGSQTFRNSFKKLCNKWGIKNLDGTPYNYTTHSYRHTIASDLYLNYGVPIATIQKAVLGHKELQMTLSYVERPDDFLKMQEDKYIEKAGEVHLSKWLKDNLRGQVLSNGICGQPQALGRCPNANACLSCEHFKTSKKFLPVLKNQLETIKSRLPVYEADGNLPNLETAKENIVLLTDLIQKLEKMEE